MNTDSINAILKEQDLKLQYKKAIEYVYDYINKNLKILDKCNFTDGKCIGNRLCKSVHSINGCCYKRGKTCNFLTNDGCSIQSISCKLFLCEYLEKKYGKIKLSEIFPVKKLFNKKQIFIIKNSFFVNNDDLVDLLLKYKSKERKI